MRDMKQLEESLPIHPDSAIFLSQVQDRSIVSVSVSLSLSLSLSLLHIHTHTHTQIEAQTHIKLVYLSNNLVLLNHHQMLCYVPVW